MPCSTHGWTNALSFIVRWKAFPLNGVQPLPLWQWYSATWATLLLQVFASAAMPLLVKTSSMVNGWLTHRVKTLLLAFVHPNKSHLKVLVVGLNCKALAKNNARLNSLQWKKPCLKSITNLMPFRLSWKSTITICKTWSSPYKRANSGSYRHVMVSVQVQPWLRLPWTSYAKAWLTKRQLSSVANLRSWTNYSTPYSLKTHLLRLQNLHVVCPQVRVQHAVKLYSSLTMLPNGTKTVTRS